jgi:ubiquinone/menaquinone biosynthesis C-methylase UbiE
LGISVERGNVVDYIDKRVFAPVLSKSRPSVLLEIGSGGGRITEVLIPKCDSLIASDISRGMLKILQKRFDGVKNLEFVLLDGHGLEPIPRESVDAVVSHDVFVHLAPWDIYNYLCEIRRILRPNGTAIIHHANTFSELGWKNFLKEVPGQVARKKMPQSFTLMTPEIMSMLAERAGLKMVECRVDVLPRDAISLLERP